MNTELFLLLIIFSVRSEQYGNGNSPGDKSVKLIEIYTNYEDTDELLKNYPAPRGRFYRPLPPIFDEDYYPLVEKLSPIDLKESAHLDRVDFHPHVEFLTRDYSLGSEYGEIDTSPSENDFVFVPSQNLPQLESEDVNTRPNLYSEENEDLDTSERPAFNFRKNRSSISYDPVKLYVPTQVSSDNNYDENNKYEEMKVTLESAQVNDPNESTKGKINQLLKLYLAKLYSQKYNSSGQNNIHPNTSPKFEANDSLGDNPKHKLIDDSLDGIKEKTIRKINKFLSVFTIVQFNNTQCIATSSFGSYLGICYTAAECQNLMGTAVGNCASGYGVCCVFKGTCGGSASQNCSYFESPNYPDYYPPGGGGVIVPTTMTPPITPTANPSPTPDPRLTWYVSRSEWSRQMDDTLSCIFEIYKANDNVSKMRIDFIDLELRSPTNGTCTDERLVISGQNINSIVPDICGYNTGQHVYVDVSTSRGPLQLAVYSSGIYRKRFQIRICQYSDSCLEPTSNCLQYYTGVTGMISSFNYDQASMLSRSVPGYFNNLNYAICIRREAGYCSITYTNVRDGVEYPFQLLNVDSSGMSTLPRGQAGADVLDCPDDYIVIDGVRLCGGKFNDGSVISNATLNAPVTDTNAGPIVVPVRTNSAVTGLGFKLFYTQNRCRT